MHITQQAEDVSRSCTGVDALTCHRSLRNGVQCHQTGEGLFNTHGDVRRHRPDRRPNRQSCCNSFFERRFSIKMVCPAYDRLRYHGMGVCGSPWPPIEEPRNLHQRFHLLRSNALDLLATRAQTVRLFNVPCNSLPILLVQPRLRPRALALASLLSHDTFRLPRENGPERCSPETCQCGCLLFASCHCFQRLEKLFLPSVSGHHCHRTAPRCC